MKNRFKIFASAHAGSTAISFAIALPVVLGMVGLATDYGIFSAKQVTLQHAADQAAIAAVKELTIVNASSTSIAAVADSLARNSVDDASVKLTVEVKIGEDRDTAIVVVTEKWKPFFAHFLNAEITPIVVSATAKVAGKTNLCLLALAPSATKAVHMDKSAKLKATGCAVYSNSSHAQSIRLDQNSEMEAASICAVGGVKAKTTAIKPGPTTDCPLLQDPLAARQMPAASPCLQTNLKLSSGKHVLKPGSYCGGLQISKTADVTFEKGDYVISDGPFKLSDDAAIIGENVAFYLKGEATTLDFTGNTTVSLTGAATGSMAGLLFFEDRSTSVGRTHRINSAKAHTLTGTIYLPNGSLRIDPNASVAQNSAYTAIIANRVEINEGPTLVLNDDYGATNVPVPEGIRTDTQVVLIR
jgi:Flp pilus assembly protein TadG